MPIKKYADIKRGTPSPVTIADLNTRKVADGHRDSILKLQKRVEELTTDVIALRMKKEPIPLTIVPGDNIRLRNLGDNKIKIYASGIDEVAQVAASKYTGPFAVIKKDDTTVTVVCLADDATYFQTSQIRSGLTVQNMTANADVTITVTGYVYAVIAYYGSAFTITFANASSMPEQTATTLYVPLARVTFTSSKIAKIMQEQEGQIYPTQHGRIGG